MSKNTDTRRKDNLPRAEAVKTAQVQKGAAVKAAKKQNQDAEGQLTVIPNTKGLLAPSKWSK